MAGAAGAGTATGVAGTASAGTNEGGEVGVAGSGTVIWVAGAAAAAGRDAQASSKAWRTGGKFHHPSPWQRWKWRQRGRYRGSSRAKGGRGWAGCTVAGSAEAGAATAGSVEGVARSAGSTGVAGAVVETGTATMGGLEKAAGSTGSTKVARTGMGELAREPPTSLDSSLQSGSGASSSL